MVGVAALRSEEEAKRREVEALRGKREQEEAIVSALDEAIGGLEAGKTEASAEGESPEEASIEVAAVEEASTEEPPTEEASPTVEAHPTLDNSNGHAPKPVGNKSIQDVNAKVRYRLVMSLIVSAHRFLSRSEVLDLLRAQGFIAEGHHVKATLNTLYGWGDLARVAYGRNRQFTAYGPREWIKEDGRRRTFAGNYAPSFASIVSGKPVFTWEESRRDNSPLLALNSQPDHTHL